MDRNLIGLRFQSLRAKKGFDKQIDMLNDFNLKMQEDVKKSAISMYEKGTRLPETELLMKFADYFGVTTDYLLGRSDVELNVVKKTMENLAKLFDQLSDADKDQAIKYMEYLNFMKKE